MKRPARMYSPAQIAVASLIGSPLPAFYLLARNYLVAQQLKEARLIMVVGSIVTALLVATAFLVPDNSLRSLPFISVVCVHQMAKMSQGALIARHKSTGGQMASWWAALGLGCLGMLLILIMAIGMTFFCPTNELI